MQAMRCVTVSEMAEPADLGFSPKTTTDQPRTTRQLLSLSEHPDCGLTCLCPPPVVTGRICVEDVCSA